MINRRSTTIHRGDIYLADLAPVVGSEQGGIRPVLIIQNDIGNQHSPTVIAAVITGQIKHRYLPTHVLLEAPGCGLLKKSMVMLEQLRTLDKERLHFQVGHIGAMAMDEVDAALKISVGLEVSREPT
jgi:mRNA interferase MazF